MANSKANKNLNIDISLNDHFGLVVFVALLLFLAAAYFLFLQPKFQEVKELVLSNLEQQRSVYELNRQKLADLRLAGSLYQKIGQPELEKFRQVVPEKYPQEKLFGEIEEIVNRGGWLLSGIRIADEDEEAAANEKNGANEEKVGGPYNLDLENVSRVRISLSVKAIDYIGLKKLLKVLENNLRLFDVQSINFSPESKAAEIVISTYYYRLEK
jgi:hypothetical protein